MAVGAASGNPLMRSFAAVIEAALLAEFSLNTAMYDPAEHKRTVKAHEAIVDAIEARDAEGAERAMHAVINAGVIRIEAKPPSP